MTYFQQLLSKRAALFVRNEDGTQVISFALWTPIILTLILSCVELGTLTLRSNSLDRALDETVREIRIGRSGLTSAELIKAEICDRATVLPGCMSTLQLEMLSLDLRSYAPPQATADCVDTSSTVTPVRNFENGTDMEVMYLRACYKYRPITPAGYLSDYLRQDTNGFTALVSASAFVNEPV